MLHKESVPEQEKRCRKTPGAGTHSERAAKHKQFERSTEVKLLSCEFNMDTACVELKFVDGD